MFTSQTSAFSSIIISISSIVRVSNFIALCMSVFLFGCSPKITLITTPQDIIQIALDSCAYNNHDLVGSCIGKKLQKIDNELVMNEIRILCKSDVRNCLVTYKTTSTVEYGADIYKKNEIWQILLRSTKDNPRLDQLKIEAKAITPRIEGGM